METNEQHDEYMLKFVLVGDSGVGKTSLISRFIVRIRGHVCMCVPIFR